MVSYIVKYKGNDGASPPFDARMRLGFPEEQSAGEVMDYAQEVLDDRGMSCTVVSVELVEDE